MHLEERLRQAELAPDPAFFEEYVADDAIIDGAKQKARVVNAHQPGQAQKFQKVEMRNFVLVEHSPAVVLTCEGTYEGPQFSGTLKFMRVWLKQDNAWRIIAASTVR
jgi:hypothetical protein